VLLESTGHLLPLIDTGEHINMMGRWEDNETEGDEVGDSTCRAERKME
jgi:hypothetical protein